MLRFLKFLWWAQIFFVMLMCGSCLADRLKTNERLDILEQKMEKSNA